VERVCKLQIYIGQYKQAVLLRHNLKNGDIQGFYSHCATKHFPLTAKLITLLLQQFF
jgi:hypothetical protein